MATNATSFVIICRFLSRFRVSICGSFLKFQIPIPKSQGKFNRQIQKRQRCHPLFEMIDAKIKVNSRASLASASRAVRLFSLDRDRLAAETNGSLSLLFDKSLRALE